MCLRVAAHRGGISGKRKGLDAQPPITRTRGRECNSDSGTCQCSILTIYITV